MSCLVRLIIVACAHADLRFCSDSYVTFEHGGIPTGDVCGGATTDWYRNVFFPRPTSEVSRGAFSASVMNAAASRFQLLVSLHSYPSYFRDHAWPVPGELFAASVNDSFELFCALEAQRSGSSCIISPELCAPTSQQRDRFFSDVQPPETIAAVQLARSRTDQLGFQGIAQAKLLVPVAQILQIYGRFSWEEGLVVNVATGGIEIGSSPDRAGYVRRLARDEIESKAFSLSADVVYQIEKQCALRLANIRRYGLT